MAYSPIAYTIPQYEDYPNNWLKAYEEGTTTPLAMATDATGGTTLAKSELDTQGFPTTAGAARFIPFIDGDYDLWLFPTEAEADANDTTNAIQFADNLNTNPFDTSGGVAVFDTVALMKAESISTGRTIQTQGYYAAGDGGGAVYLIVAPQAFDGYGDHELANSNIAVLQTSNVIDARQYGAKVDDSTDDYASVNAAIVWLKANGGGTIDFPEGVCQTSSYFDQDEFITLRGLGSGLSSIKPHSTWSETADPRATSVHANYGNLGMINIESAVAGTDAIIGLTIDGDGSVDVGIKDYISVQRNFSDVVVKGCNSVGCWLIGTQNCTFTLFVAEENNGPGLVLDGGASNNIFIKPELQQFVDGGAYILAIRQNVPEITSPALGTHPKGNTFISAVIERNTASTTALVLHSAGNNNQFISSNLATRSGFGTELAVDFTKDATVVAGTVNQLCIFLACDFTTGNSAGGKVLQLVNMGAVELNNCSVTDQPTFADIDDDSTVYDHGNNLYGTHSTAIWNPTGVKVISQLVLGRDKYSTNTMRASSTSHEAFSVKQYADTQSRVTMTGDGYLRFSDGSSSPDARIGRAAANIIALSAGDGFGVGNHIANTNTPSGATVQAMPIYDQGGNLAGYIPVYAAEW